jgi:hypothetical protein
MNTLANVPLIALNNGRRVFDFSQSESNSKEEMAITGHNRDYLCHDFCGAIRHRLSRERK